MRPTVFVDVETDGLHPNRRAWEIALVRRSEEGVVERHMFVAIDLSNSDPGALSIGRFWDRRPSGRKISGKGFDAVPSEPVVSVHDAAKEVMRLTHEARIVGAVPSFDTETLARMLRHCGYLPTWHHRLRCVETLTAGHLGRDVGGLKDCADALGVGYDPDALHTAMGDARLAMAIWDRIMGAES